MEPQKIFEKIEEGNHVLFNDKKKPLKVLEKSNKRILLEGPRGGFYQIFRSERGLEVSKKDSKRFSNVVKDLRKTGSWKKISETFWKHSGTGASLELVKRETGFWDIEFEGFEPVKDLPGYGFINKNYAREEIDKILNRYPEGK